MKMGCGGIKLGVLVVAAWLGGLAPVAPAFAQTQPTAAAPANNRIEKIIAAEQGGDIILKLSMAQPLAAIPASFSVASPARIAFDFPDTANGLGRNSQTLNAGDLRSVSIVQVGDRTRLVLNLARVFPYEARIEGKDILITLAAGHFKEAASMTPQASQFAPAAIGQADRHAIRDINFRRGKEGEGRLVVDLSDPNAGIDIRQQGNSLIVDFLKTEVPEQLRRKLDVVDFGTPVSSVLTQTQGGNVSPGQHPTHGFVLVKLVGFCRT